MSEGSFFTENDDGREKVHVGRDSKMVSRGLMALGPLYSLANTLIFDFWKNSQISLRADISYIIVKILQCCQRFKTVHGSHALFQFL